ncbi:MAG: OsmC family peroxiredoxin [Hyphomicrobiales bacterium]|nr:OsmC family peroxiredoxin [Hyphomicrobiales bacterium]
MVHLYTATTTWHRDPDSDFAHGRYSRGHLWRFDGGMEVPASASPQVVPKAYAHEAAVDPEEAFVASLSSCHMLTFLDVARRAGFVVDRYEDAAEGVMEKNEDGACWIARVTLRPQIAFAGAPPDSAQADDLHHRAHALCFIANSVRTAVQVVPTAS